jgi:hypothetical protein
MGWLVWSRLSAPFVEHALPVLALRPVIKGTSGGSYKASFAARIANCRDR